MSDPSTTAVELAGHKLDLYGLTKEYGGHRALYDVSLSVAPGEFLTILGPSGSGKTTVLMAIAGFLAPTHGTITLDGRDITRLPPDERDFGVVFQGYALFPHLSVFENVAFPLRVRGLSKADIAAKVGAVLDLVRLGGLADRRPKQLSGGQQQRVALARALVFSPKLLLLDEPMGALDRQLKGELQAELRRLHHRIGTTFINVTHDQEEAMAISDRIAVMRAGEIVEIGAPSSLYTRPKTRFVAGFLGKSNILAGKVLFTEAARARVAIGAADIIHSGDPSLVPGADLLLALRPERIRIGTAEPHETGISARVEDIVIAGPITELSLSTGEGIALTAHCVTGAGKVPRIGETVPLAWSTEATVAVEDR